MGRVARLAFLAQISEIWSCLKLVGVKKTLALLWQKYFFKENTTILLFSAIPLQNVCDKWYIRPAPAFLCR